MSRRTIRRYAHELYPHAEEGETRPLAVEVPYLYARAAGMEVTGTSWCDMTEGDAGRLAWERMVRLTEARRTAFVADALLQGMTGDEAWAWADQRNWDETGEIAYDRAAHYGVDVAKIKPYRCGPEPSSHEHYGEPHGPWGSRPVFHIDGKESECVDCTEEVPGTAETPA